jgi:hypothetical protein
VQVFAWDGWLMNQRKVRSEVVVEQEKDEEPMARSESREQYVYSESGA